MLTIVLDSYRGKPDDNMKQYVSESISLNEEDTGLINQKDLLSDSFKESGGAYVIQVKPEFLKHFLRSGECL